MKGRFAFTLTALVAATSGLCPARAQSADKTPPSGVPTRLKAALECLVTADFVKADLKALGLNVGDVASVRYRSGSVPGMLPTPHQIQIAVYSRDQKRGWLLFAEPATGGGFVAIRNAYRLSRQQDKWEAEEGNGGLATYAAMGRLASTLFTSPAFRMQLSPGGGRCRVD